MASIRKLNYKRTMDVLKGKDQKASKKFALILEEIWNRYALTLRKAQQNHQLRTPVPRSMRETKALSTPDSNPSRSCASPHRFR